MDRSFLTDNPKLVDEIVCEVKSQGVFDQFRRNCIADVDTKPAYQNLRQRVENIVSNFLNEQVWRPDLNKNQLREKLRKHITEAGFLETGVERIVDQVVNPKINSVFLPKIEDISYKYLGIEKPKPLDDQTFQSEDTHEDINPKILPSDLDDLEAVSPDSTGSKKSFKDSTEDLKPSIDSIKAELNDSGEKVDDDFESPAFEPLKGSLLTGSDSINGEEDSKLSDISGLTSQDSVNSERDGEQPTEAEIKAPTIEVVEQPAVTQSQQVIPENINQDSVLSQVSSNSHLSIVTDSNNKSSEVDLCEEAQMPKFSENSFNNPDVDDKERKPLLTSFDIKQDEIKFEGTERRSSLHDLNDDIKLEEDVVMEELKDPPRTDSVGDESVKTESSSSCMDPIISETKDLSLKDECRSNEADFKFEEPAVSVDTTDMSNPNDKHKSKDLKGERKSDGKSEHKSHRRDKDKSSHHSRDKYKDGDRKHYSSSSKHSSSSSSGRKEHRSESRSESRSETKKSTSSDHRRDESSKSVDRSNVKSVSSSHSSSRDKDSNHKSSRSHDDRHDKSFKDPTDKDKNRSRQHDRSSNKSRTQHRDDKTKRRSHDDDGKKKSGQESKSKSIDDDHAVHHEKPLERRRSTDRDSDDGSGERGNPTSTNQQQTEVVSVNSSAITNSTSSSSFSSTASSCTDEHEKREAAGNVQTSSTDSDDNFVPTSAPVVVDQILIGNDINLEMLMETSNMDTGEMNPVMSMLHQSMSDDNEMKIKKPKVASNIFEVQKLIKVRKQIEREKKKRLEKLLVHTKQMVGSNSNDEQGVELEFSMMNSSAPSISSPIKPKEIHFEAPTPAPVHEKRNSGEFIIDMKEMEKQLKKKRPEKPATAAKYVHKFDEILAQIDKPRKRDSKGNTPPISPIHEMSSKGVHDRSPKFEQVQRKYVREQSKECTVVDSEKPTVITPPSRHQRDDKKIEKSDERTQDGSKWRKDSSSSKSPPYPHSPTKATKSNAAGYASTSAKHEKVLTSPKQSTSKQIKIDLADSRKVITPKTSPKSDDRTKVTGAKTVNSSVDLIEDNSVEFCGFPAKESFYVAVLDYVTIKNILETKSKSRILHIMNCDQSLCDIFTQHSTNVFDVSDGNESRLISGKFAVSKSTDTTKEPKNSLNLKNGVRTSTSQSQHKLFIENNQFAGNSGAKQISRKRRTSVAGQATAAKIVRLVDSKMSGDEVEAEETSPTPSEQSKENQIIHPIKKHNRTTDNTSNELEQASAEKSESNKPNQRYASEDLYKPRPILSRTRRRGIENGEI